MAIITEKAPASLLDVVASGLAALPPAATGIEGGEGAQMYRPLPLYGAATAALADWNGSGAAPLERVGWRVLIDEGPALAIAEVRLFEDAPALTALWRGVVAGLLADTSVAAETALDDGQLYKARVIALPEIGLEALWLHVDHDNDKVMPLLEQEGQLSSFKTFAAEARRRALTIKSPQVDAPGAAKPS